MRLSKRAKRRLAVLLAITILAGGGLASWRIVRRVQARRLTTEARIEGLAAFRTGDYEISLSRLGYYLRRQVSDLEVLLAYAESRSKVPGEGTGHLVQSARFYADALRLAPENQVALDRLLELYPRLGLRVEWMTIADRILVLDPNHVEAMAAKVAGLRLGGDLDGALSLAARLIEIEPQNTTWRTAVLGIRLARNDPDDQLISLCDEWIGEDTGDGRLHLVKARLLASLGRIESARTAAGLAVARGLHEPDLFRSLIAMLEQLDLAADAEAAIVDALHRYPEAQWVIECAVARLWRLQRYEEAIDALLEAERTVPVISRELLRRKAMVQIAMGSDEAVATLGVLKQRAQQQATEQRVADEAWAAALLASLDRRTNRAATLKSLQLAIALQPQDPMLHYLAGQENARALEHELAAVWFERAAMLDPNWVVPRLARGRSLLAMGRATEALDVARGLIRASSNASLDPWVLFARAWLAEDGLDDAGLTDPATGQPIDLVSLLRSLHERSGRNPTIGTLLVRAYLRMDRRQDAVEMIEQMMAYAEIDPTDLLNLSRISDQAGLGLERRVIDRARALAGPTLEIAAAEARLLEREGRLDEALALLDESLLSAATPPGVPVRAMLRAELLVRAGRTEAVGALQDLLENHASSTAVINFVLRQQVAWHDESLVEQAIDGLGAMLGEGSPQVLLARANFLLHFQPQDAAAKAQAMVLVSDVLQRVPDSVAALVTMSRLLREGDDPHIEQAARYLRRALEVRPDRIDLYPKLISLLQQQGDRDGAGEYLRRLRGRSDVPRDLRHVEIGLLLDQGDFETAATRLGDIVGASAPQSEQLVLASLHSRAEDYEAAERIYVRLLASPDRSASVIEAAAGFYARIGRGDEAFALLDAPELRDTPGLRALLVGRFHQKTGDVDEATRWLEEAVAAGADNVMAWIELARHWLLLGDTEEARRVAASGLELHPDNAVLTITLGMAGLATAADLMGDLGVDSEAVQATVSLYKQAADETGNLVPREQDLADSRELYQQFPLFRPAWHLAALMHAAAGRADDAIRIARQASNRFPGAAEPPQWAVQMLVEQGRLDEAFDMAHAWRRRSLEDPLAADTVIASLLVDLQRPSDAVRQLAPHSDRILAAPDRLSDSLAVWVGALLLDRRFDEAAAIARPLMSEDDLWPARWLALAATADVETTRQAIKIAEPYLDPTPLGALALADHWLRLAGRSGESSDYQRAEEFALRAGEDADLEIPSLHVGALVATARDDLATVESRFLRILALNPQDVTALNNLAYALVQIEGRCEDAAAFSGRALALQSQNPHILDTHARALTCRGDLAEAESAARLALSSRRNDPAMVLTLVRIQMAQSRFAAAETALDRAEELLRRAGRVGDSTWTEVEAVRDRLREQRSTPVR